MISNLLPSLNLLSNLKHFAITRLTRWFSQSATQVEQSRKQPDNSFYSQTSIPGGMYTGTDADTPTFGVGATFVTSATVSENTVYNIVAAVFDNFKRFKKLHPAFSNLTEE